MNTDIVNYKKEKQTKVFNPFNGLYETNRDINSKVKNYQNNSLSNQKNFPENKQKLEKRLSEIYLG
jgi:hypothetical protein